MFELSAQKREVALWYVLINSSTFTPFNHFPTYYKLIDLFALFSNLSEITGFCIRRVGALIEQSIHLLNLHEKCIACESWSQHKTITKQL